MRNEKRMNIKPNPQLMTTQPQYGLILLLTILCLAGAALAANALRGHGNVRGRATLSSLEGGLVNLEINVAGNITLLGKSTVQIHTVADFNGPLPTPIPPSSGVVTAANGDTITFTPRWAVQEIAPGVFRTFGPFDITGGTGRFVGAKGSGDYRGIVDTKSGDVTCEFTGELLR